MLKMTSIVLKGKLKARIFEYNKPPYEVETGTQLNTLKIKKASYFYEAFRARDQVRTGDIQLGRLTLYQLSYSRNSGANI